MEASKLDQAGSQPSDAQSSAADAHRQQVVRDALEERGGLSSNTPPAEAQRRGAGLARILRLGVSDRTSSPGDMAAIGDLETELALLREENARLKVERHRPADAGHVIERMRSIRQEGSSQPDGEHGASRAIAECLDLREGLMDACEEVQRAMQGIRGRLEALTGDIQGRAGERPRPERVAAPTVEPLDTQTDDMDTDSSELAQSVA